MGKALTIPCKIPVGAVGLRHLLTQTLKLGSKHTSASPIKQLYPLSTCTVTAKGLLEAAPNVSKLEAAPNISQLEAAPPSVLE